MRQESAPREKRRLQSNLHPRLQRLDREILVEKSRRFDYLYATGQGVRIRVCVMRDVDRRCYATAEVSGRILKVDGGHSPSFAFLIISKTISRMLCKMSEAEREIVRLENPMVKNISDDLGEWSFTR